MHHHFIAILTLGLLVFSTGGIIAPPLSEFTKPNEDLTSPVMNNSHLNPDKLNLPDFNEMHPTGDNSDSIEPVNEGADSPSNTIFDRRYRKSPFQSFDNQIAKKYLQHDIDNAKKHFQMARTDRFIIQFDSMSAVRSNYRALQNQIYTEVRPFVSLPFMTISTINEHVFDLLYDLSGVERVYVDSYAQVLDLEDWEQNILAKRTVNPKPMWYSSESLTGATTLHNLKLNGSGVKIAIIDTGIDKTHPDLDDLDNDPTTNDPKVIAEASFVDYDEDGLPDESPEDTTYHGTHVAGIAAGNGIQIGMAPGAWLMNAKAIDVGGGAYVSWILEAIDWAIVNEADIISMSFAWVMEIQTLLNEAVEEAWDQGVVVVIAIGNSGTQPNAVSSPAISRKTISVGSTTSYDTVAPFSSWGLSLIGTIDPDISAPGVDIFSTVPGGGYAVSSGTSMATPHVSGAAALLLQAFKEKNPTPDQIKFALLKTADDLGESPLHQGTGRLNVSRAYEEWTSLSTALLFPNTKSTPLQFYATPNETISFQAYVLANQSGTYNLQVSGVLASNISLSSSSVTGLGHHFVSVEIAISTGAVGGVYNGTIELTNGARIIFSPLDALDITVLVVEAQNDASSGRDGGEILDTAISVPLGTYEGNLNQTTDDRDLYKLTLSAMVNITAYLSMHDYGSSDYDLLLINENGSLLQYSGHLYSVPEIISFQADYTGTYYLMVMNFGGAGLYSLEINETTISDSVISTGEILGSYTTFTVDSDNDGLINALIISFQVFVSHDGMYDIVGHLAQNRSNWEFGKYVFSSVEEFLELKAGINQVNLTFMGEACFGQFFNGSYLLDYVFLGKSTTLKIMDECVRPYWTPTFNYTDFETPIVYFDASSWNETAIDEDNNGKAEALILSIDMVITAFTEPSNYRVGIPLLLTTTNLTSQISVQFEELFENLYGPTRRTASFSVALDWLLDARTFTGTFIIPTIEYDSFPESYNVPWSYLLWYQSEFRSPSAIEPVIEIEFTDRGVDTDSNGKYDFLNITAHLTSHQTSNFIFIMVGDTLFSFPDQRAILPYSSIAYTTVLLQPGQSRNVSISYIGTNIHANKLNGSYIIPTIFISYNDTSPGSNSVHNSKFIYGFNTSAYNWTDFDPVPVRYENNWVEEAIDEDNNGKLDAIQLNFTVTVVDPGKYTFEIIIVDDLTFGEQVAHVEYLLKEFNASGDYIISTIIDGDVFWANKYQGRLSLKRLGIINGHYISLPYSSQTPDYLAIHSDAAFTKVYSWKDFLDAVPFYFTDFFVKGVNTDSDSKFEELELTIEYHGKSHASVIAELGLFPKVIIEEMEHAASMTTLYFYSGSLYAEVYVQPGIFSDGYYNISLTFTAQDVYLYLYTDTWIINIRA
ncbi:MAG: S8 family serine peptidase, partial [Candidatus Hodarchaeota archaeon]